MRWKALGKPKLNFGTIRPLDRNLVRNKRVHHHQIPGLKTKKPKPSTGHGTILEGWLNGPCKIHSTEDATPTHSLRACWILRQVAKSGKDLLILDATEHHPRDNNTVLTVFETFASNNRRKRALRSLAEVCHVAAVNPWSDTAISFNASDEPKFRTARAPAALVLTPIVDGFRLTKVLMDGGSGLNLIYEETLQKWKQTGTALSEAAEPLEE